MKSLNNSIDKPTIKNHIDVLNVLLDINRKLENISANALYNTWLPKKTVMRFFDYGETQMRQIEKEYSLVTSKIKARKFYLVSSILKLIELNKIVK
jgi:hypothetical protein